MTSFVFGKLRCDAAYSLIKSKMVKPISEVLTLSQRFGLLLELKLVLINFGATVGTTIPLVSKTKLP